jgi:hypothetical protein
VWGTAFGFINFTRTATGLSGGTSYNFRLRVRRTSGSDSVDYSGNFTGSGA